MTKPTVAKKSSTTKHKGTMGAIPGQVILNKCAAIKVLQQKDSVERKKLAALTGIAGKSTIGKGLTFLRNQGWMDVSPKEITITEEGFKNADTDDIDVGDIPTTNKEHHEAMKKMHKLKPKACELLDVIVDGKTYQKKDVADSIGMSINSTFGKVLTALKQANLVEVTAKTIRLSDEMFPIEPRVE